MGTGFFSILRAMLFAVLLLPAAAQADVNVTFYSHDFGKNFPHAFFVLKGELESGEKIDTSYGFTAVNVSPGILWGSVKGHIETPKDKYIKNSNPHFTVQASDAEYRKLMVLVNKWQNREQKSYNLNKRNCVHFAGEAIQILGYNINTKTKNWKKPKSFMLEVMSLNPGLK